MAVPVIQFNVFTVDNSTPATSGRHLETALNWSQKADATTSGYLDMGTVNNTSAKVSTSTVAVVPFCSNMNGATTVSNMKFWMPTQTAITTGTVTFNEQIQTAWQSGIALTDASGSYTSSSLPSVQNVNRQDGTTTVTGANSDSQAMEFIYVSTTVDTDVPAGEYGVAPGAMKFRLTFDFS